MNIKRYIQALAIPLAAGAVAVAGSGIAHADNESDYLTAIGASPQQRDAALVIGYAICGSLRGGTSPLQTLDQLGVDVAAAPAVANELVRVASTTLCRQG